MKTLLEYKLECSNPDCHYSDKSVMTIIELPQEGGHLQHYLINNKCTICGSNLIRERAFTNEIENMIIDFELLNPTTK